MDIEKLANELNFEACDHFDIDWARKSFIDGDAEGFGCAGYSRGGSLALVFDNFKQLRDRGIYEAALMHAFIGCKTNNRHWSVAMLRFLFSLADRAKLLALGDPPPIEGLRVYRGVSGIGRARRVRGFSWTTSIDQACWFARRLYQPDPAVVSVVLDPSSIFCITNHREENEAIAYPLIERPVRMMMGKAEIEERAQRAEDERQKRRSASITAAIASREAKSTAK